MKLSEFIAAHPQLDAEIGLELGDIAEQVVHLDRAGRVTIQIGMEKKGGRVMTTLGHVAKPPKPDAEAGLFYVKSGELTKRGVLPL